VEISPQLRGPCLISAVAPGDPGQRVLPGRKARIPGDPETPPYLRVLFSLVKGRLDVGYALPRSGASPGLFLLRREKIRCCDG